jgi:glucose/arabinose dehydrogenase
VTPPPAPPRGPQPDRRPTNVRLMTRAAIVVGVAALIAAAACGGDDGGDDGALSATTSTTAGDETTTTRGSTTATQPAPPPPLESVGLTLTEVASADRPMALVTRPGTDSMYLAERAGVVRPFAGGRLGEPILDISDDVITDAERGLLDIEFSADGAVLYLHYSQNPNGDTRVVSYPMAGDRVDTAGRRELLAVEQPFANHNGGDIEIGPDGFLYIALGDGGSGGDPMGNGQNTQALLGKILRVDPAAPAGGAAYGIPDDNPFADGAGGAPEVWIYGVRNPWRIAFDAEGGDLWVADVGQNAVEEINLLPAASGGGRGANLGWNEMEGSRSFEGGSNPDGGVLPIVEYEHADGGCSVTGGVVYRGSAIPGLVGAYLFTDYCDGSIRAARAAEGVAVDAHEYDAGGSALVSFGVDPAGEVYVLSLDGPIYRLDPA